MQAAFLGESVKLSCSITVRTVVAQFSFLLKTFCGHVSKRLFFHRPISSCESYRVPEMGSVSLFGWTENEEIPIALQ
jgi:hypothetical protein